MIQYLRFVGAMFGALFDAARERYYAHDMRHIDPMHPDLWIITRRYEQSRMKVNDFLRKVT